MYRIEAPSPLKNIKKLIFAILANGIFFGPRRKVTVEVCEDHQIKELSQRTLINGHLENFYNKRVTANTHIPYYWWQGSTPVTRPEPLKNSFKGNLSLVPATTKELIIEKIKKITGASSINDSDRLANDLAIDSLSLMDLAVWLESEFGIPIDDMSSLDTVNDCFLAAAGQIVDKKDAALKPLSDKWFQSRSGSKLTFPEKQTVTDAFLHQAKSNPREIIIADELSGQKSYRDILTSIFVIKPFLEKIKSRRVGIMLPATASAATVFLSTLFSGKTPVMFNWTVGIGNLKHGILETGTTHLVTAKALHKKLVAQGINLSELDVKWIFVDEIAATVSNYRKAFSYLKAVLLPSSLGRIVVQDHAAILFTSGSESKPKTVPLSHENIMANMKDFTSVLSVNGGDKLLGMLPPFHSLGLVGTIILPLCLGLKTVYHANPTEGLTIARLIEHYKVSTLIGTPTFISGIINAGETVHLETLKLIFTGAEKCPDHVYDKFHVICPEAVLCEGYGITECSPLVSVNHIDNSKPGTIGKVLPSMEYAIVDIEKNQRVGTGEQGILLVRGANVFSGYLNVDNSLGFYEFEEKLWYQTGDFVKEEDDGILTFCGRKKRFIKLGGEMISLPAIEAALQKDYPEANDNGPTLAVEAANGDEYQEIVLFTTLEIDREDANKSIRQAGLSPLFNIRRLENVDEIPVLGTGKTDYKVLKASLEV